MKQQISKGDVSMSKINYNTLQYCVKEKQKIKKLMLVRCVFKVTNPTEIKHIEVTFLIPINFI